MPSTGCKVTMSEDNSPEGSPALRGETDETKSRSQISEILESTDDMIWSVDPVNLGLLTFNRGLKDYFLHGWSLDIREGMTPRQLHPSEALAQWWCNAYTRTLNEGPFSVEHSTTAGRHILFAFNLLKRGDEIFGVSVFGKDISEWKRVEDELRKSEERYQAFISHTSEGIYRLESDQPIPISLPEKDQVDLILKHAYIDECNDANAHIYGLASAEELVGIRLADYLHSFDPLFTEAINNFIRSGYRLVDAEVQMVDKNGKSQCIETSLNGIVDDGHLIRVWGVQREITERKNMNKALRDSERRFRAAIDSFPHSFVIYDKDLRIRYINRAGAELRGLPEESIIGHTNEEVLAPEYTRTFADRLRKARDTKTAQTFEYTYTLRRGAITIVINYIPLFDEGGDLCHILGIGYDITEIREAEKKLEQALDENRKQNRLLRTVAEELRGNYDKVEDLLYKVSHDLMAPMITIQGFLGLLKKDVEACNRLRVEIDIGLIGDAVTRMQELLSEALELSSLGKLAKPACDVPFGDVVEDALRHLSNKVASSRAEIITDEGLPRVHIDRDRIVDVLIGLIDGFIRYPAEGRNPRVQIGHHAGDDGPVFFVKGEGNPMNEMGLGDASCHFSDAEESSGASMGLAITRRIIEMHGGRMWTDCGPEGCAVYFTLPEAEDAR